MMMLDLEFYGTRLLKQQSPCRYVAPLGHNILTPNQSVFARTSKCYVFNRGVGNLTVSMLASSAIDGAFDSKSHQTKDNTTGI